MEQRSGLVPYLFYNDAAAMIDWYKTVFGFVEHSRYTNEDGGVRNAEMIVGGTELWMDGNPPAGWQPSAVPWIGVWVDDPDKMYEKIKAHGVEIDSPQEQALRSALDGHRP